MNAKEVKHNKKLIRSALSGKIVNGREVIMANEAEEYLKKMGYKIFSPQSKLAVAGMFTILLTLSINLLILR